MNNQKNFTKLALTLLFSAASIATGQTKLGFDLSNSIVPPQELIRPGVPRDGFPSIDNPKFTPVSEVEYLNPEDIVVGFTKNGVTRAYPLRIMVRHEVLNDSIGDFHLAVIYCPLVKSVTIHDRTFNGKTVEFGVSGLLYNSDMVMYDRETGSLWSQLAFKCISGKMVGTPLTWLHSEQMTWEEWKKRNPKGEVLNTDTGYDMNYFQDAYPNYFTDNTVRFPYKTNRNELSKKELTAALFVNNTPKCYLLEVLYRHSGKWIEDEVGGTPIKVRYTPEIQHFEAQDMEGNPIPVAEVFWFAWQAFYPDTELYQYSITPEQLQKLINKL